MERIRDAGRFGLQVYYGDGTRLDVLRAAGAEKAEMICICIDEQESTTKIIEIIHENFQKPAASRVPLTASAIDLMNLDVDYQIREVFESAIVFGRAALEELGTDPSRCSPRPTTCASAISHVSCCRRKSEPWAVPSSSSAPRSRPSRSPSHRRAPRALSPETRDILGEGVS